MYSIGKAIPIQIINTAIFVIDYDMLDDYKYSVPYNVLADYVTLELIG